MNKTHVHINERGRVKADNSVVYPHAISKGDTVMHDSEYLGRTMVVEVYRVHHDFITGDRTVWVHVMEKP